MPDTPSPELIALQAAVIGRFALERELGRGGMGIVFLARDIALDRLVAIKLLPPQLVALPGLRTRFLREARLAARLAHPNIVPIHAVEEHAGLVYFIMGFIAGESLAELVRREGPLAPSRLARVVQEVAWALAYAHQHGVVHRDIKPENILIERGSGRALVADFGIAVPLDATPERGVQGTARYVSPEQAAGEAVDGRSDLYSLGVTAFYALTGRFPFEGDDTRALLARRITLPAPPVATLRPNLPRALASAIDRCLARSPDDRFATGEELAAALEQTGPAPIPRVLQRLVREISGLGVDIVGFGTLGIVAFIAYALSSDAMGYGWVYTVGLTAMLVSLAALRGLSMSRLTREAAAEGWGIEDLELAFTRDAREHEEASPEKSRLGIGPRAALYLAGLGALVLLWIGPKDYSLSHLEGPLAWAIELICLGLPVALGRWFGAALERPKDGKPGLITRYFLRIKGGLIFKAARFGLKRSGPPVPPAADQPTEVLLAGAARELLRALPPADRERWNGADDLLRRLEQDAVLLRRRLGELDQAQAQVGGRATEERRRVTEDLERARQAAGARLGSTVSAMENLRLDLLRVRAGLAPGDDLTGNLAALDRLERDVDARLEAEDAMRSED